MAACVAPVPTPGGRCRSIPPSRGPEQGPAPISISSAAQLRDLVSRRAGATEPPARLAFGSLSDLARVNSVQGLALGAGLEFNLAGGAVTLEPRVGYGTSNERWTGGVTVRLSPFALRLFH